MDKNAKLNVIHLFYTMISASDSYFTMKRDIAYEMIRKGQIEAVFESVMKDIERLNQEHRYYIEYLMGADMV